MIIDESVLVQDETNLAPRWRLNNHLLYDKAMQTLQLLEPMQALAVPVIDVSGVTVPGPAIRFRLDQQLVVYIAC